MGLFSLLCSSHSIDGCQERSFSGFHHVESGPRSEAPPGYFSRLVLTPLQPEPSCWSPPSHPPHRPQRGTAVWCGC